MASDSIDRTVPQEESHDESHSPSEDAHCEDSTKCDTANTSGRFSGSNKRKSSRQRPSATEIAAVYVGGDRYSGELVDESNGGLSVRLTDNVAIRTGARVRVAARRKCTTAVVVRCTESEQGSLLGLRT